MATKGKVLVAISGGVDSAVATLLLKRKGYKVEGVFMQNWDARIEQPSQQCCSIDKDYSDAVKVASILDIPLKRVNFVREYWQNVFSNLIDGYKKGLTPNPDLMCNKEIKFGSLLKWAKTHDFDLLATGHYARIISQEGRLWIGQAVNIEKDQSYFLANVTESSLDSIIFPLGDIPSKDHVKFMALQNGLGFLLEKPESMGICFVGKRQSFSQFLSDFVEGRPGHIIQQETGKILGTHNGVELYTLGQHLAIGGMPARMFVVEKRQKEAQLYVSSNRDHWMLRPKGIIVKVEQQNFTLQGGENLFCSIRSADKIGIRIKSINRNGNDGTLKIICDDYLNAPAPGQAAVIYQELSKGIRIVKWCGLIVEIAAPPPFH